MVPLLDRSNKPDLPADSVNAEGQSGFQATIDNLLGELQRQYYPQTLAIPFNPKHVFLLSDERTFMAFSADGRACRLAPGSVTETTTTFVTENELQAMTMLNDDEFLIADRFSLV